jgi:predicted nucleotidyltransferase
MLKIFNTLKPFFEDVFREISVREYAREQNISPPNASKILKDLENEGLLISKTLGRYIFFRVNRESPTFKEFAKLYWQTLLKSLTQEIYEEMGFRKIVLFGSIAKIENTKNSDVDLFIDADEAKLDIFGLEAKLNRPVQLHFKKELKNKLLKENIKNGILIK